MTVPSIERLRKMHDTDLREIDSDEARQVLAGRTRAARQIRVTVAPHLRQKH